MSSRMRAMCGSNTNIRHAIQFGWCNRVLQVASMPARLLSMRPELLACEPRDHVRRDQLRLDARGIVLVARRPDPGLAALDRKLALDREPVRHVEARTAELAHLRGKLHHVA